MITHFCKYDPWSYTKCYMWVPIKEHKPTSLVYATSYMLVRSLWKVIRIPLPICIQSSVPVERGGWSRLGVGLMGGVGSGKVAVLVHGYNKTCTTSNFTLSSWASKVALCGAS